MMLKQISVALALTALFYAVMCGVSHAAPHGHHHVKRHAHHHAHASKRMVADGRPAACRVRIGGRLIPWCGCWLAQQFGLHDPSLWLARNWARVGKPAPGPAKGVIGVKPHHVFKVLKVVAPGRVLAISGNDGGKVRVRVRSTQGVIAWRTF